MVRRPIRPRHRPLLAVSSETDRSSPKPGVWIDAPASRLNPTIGGMPGGTDQQRDAACGKANSEQTPNRPFAASPFSADLQRRSGRMLARIHSTCVTIGVSSPLMAVNQASKP